MKNNKVTVRLDERETERIQAKADLVGLSIGQYMRFISLSADIEVNKSTLKPKCRTKSDK